MKIFCFLFFTVCAAFLNVAAQTVKDEDFQSWNDFQLTAPLGKKVDFVLTGTLRFGNSAQRLVDRRAGIAFVYKPTKWLSVQPAYLNIVTTPRNARERTENRVSIAATYQFPFKKFTLSDRNTFERRWRSPQNATRYRNRLNFEIPFSKNSKTRFTASEEVFYDWSLGKWARNRASVGISRTVNKHLTVDVYFMRQNDGTVKPGDLSIIGTIFKIRS